jgi:hypothetical protein
VVVRFLAALEQHYRPNPYHNSTHAADVTQAAACILQSVCQCLPGGLTQLEVFSVIVAAAVHDLAHPGVNNDFLVNSRDAAALTYNDRSVNENFHVSTAFSLAYSWPGANIFGGLSREEEKQVRRRQLPRGGRRPPPSCRAAARRPPARRRPCLLPGAWRPPPPAEPPPTPGAPPAPRPPAGPAAGDRHRAGHRHGGAL